MDEPGDLELLLHALVRLQLGRLLADEPAHQLGHPQGRAARWARSWRSDRSSAE